MSGERPLQLPGSELTAPVAVKDAAGEITSAKTKKKKKKRDLKKENE